MTGMFCCIDITSRKGGEDRLYKRSNLIEFRKKGDMVRLMNVSEETRRFIGLSRKDMELAKKESSAITGV